MTASPRFAQLAGAAGEIAGRTVLTVWLGSLWTIGYIVAPALFATLDDRSVAGGIAGTLFHIEARLSLVCGAVLLALLWIARRQDGGTGWRPWLVVLMLALVVVGEWLVGPILAGAARGSREFAALHGLSAVLYLATSVAGLVLLVTWRPLKRAM